MSNGVLGKTMSTANTEVTPYTVPVTAEFATVSINLVNKGTVEAKVKIAIGTSLTAGAADYIEFGGIIPPNGGILERTCIVCSQNENIIVEADSNDVAIRVYGLEKLGA